MRTRLLERLSHRGLEPFDDGHREHVRRRLVESLPQILGVEGRGLSGGILGDGGRVVDGGAVLCLRDCDLRGGSPSPRVVLRGGHAGSRAGADGRGLFGDDRVHLLAERRADAADEERRRLRQLLLRHRARHAADDVRLGLEEPVARGHVEGVQHAQVALQFVGELLRRSRQHVRYARHRRLRRLVPRDVGEHREQLRRGPPGGHRAAIRRPSGGHQAAIRMAIRMAIRRRPGAIRMAIRRRPRRQPPECSSARPTP